jgi:hypothetical protein
MARPEVEALQGHGVSPGVNQGITEHAGDSAQRQPV